MNRLELSARSRVREGKLEGFKTTAAEFTRQVREKDTGTIRFDWFLSADQTEAELREEYAGPQAFIDHKMHTAEVTERLFAEFATDHRVAFFGDPPPMLVARVESTPMGKTVTWFKFFQGLGPEPVSYWSGTAASWEKPGLEVGAHMTVRPGQAEGFRKQAAEMLRLTQQKDTRTLRYDWFISQDGTRCDVREAYVDGQGLIEHNANIAAARDVLFERFADDHLMTGYGEPTPEIQELIRSTHMEGHFQWFGFLDGLGDTVALQPSVSGSTRA